MDPPQHREWRAIYNEAISRVDIGEMTEFIRTCVRRRIAEIETQKECEIVSALCEPVPAETICHLVGIFDPETICDVRRTALAMFAAQGDPDLFSQKQAEFAQVTLPEIHARKSEPKDDFLTYLSNLEVEGRKLNDEDYVVLLAAFLGAGHHSTTSAMASSISEIFSRKDLRDKLRDNPDLIPRAIEEVLRLRPPFFGFFRRATHDVSVGETAIQEGQDIYCGWAAANRDPAVFDRPSELDIERPSIRHMSFGFGIHSCPGAPLARLEVKVLLEELLNAFPDLELRDGMPEYAFGGGDYAFIPQLFVHLGARSTQD
jgi:cytochrome P450